MKKIRWALLIGCIVICGGLTTLPKDTLSSRFTPPIGFVRSTPQEGSFGHFLQQLPVKPKGSKVKLFDGRIKQASVYDAVIDLPIGKKDLQQCADAVIRLRAEWLYREKRYDEIKFNFTNGFPAEYSKWRQGYRITITGNICRWVKSPASSDSYEDFWKYLETVFTYAGTLSLSKSMTPKDISKIEIGDVFIQGGSPGHAVIVVDLAVNQKGERKFLLAQSYMPAQEIQVLKNPSSGSPWYTGSLPTELKTPEWTFKLTDLKSF